jgi:hypothetical protein
MSCLLCASDNQSKFSAETNIHLGGLENVNNPGVLLFPRLLVCLDCGCSSFSIPAAELSQLAVAAPKDRRSADPNVNDTLLLLRGIKLAA